MNNIKIIKIAAAFAFLLTFTACSMKQEGNRTVIKEPGKSITVIENENTETDQPSISVEKINRYDGMEITDWLDEQTIVLAKENPELGKMSLLENGEFYPRSIYLYHLDTKKYDTVKAYKDMFLGGAILSPDKKHLLYYEYSIGDTAHYLMSMDEKEQSLVKDNILGIAITAEWDDANSVIGVSYAGGAYMADTNRNIIQVADLQEQLLTVQKTKDKFYYITIDDSLQLHMLDMITNEKKNLNVENVDEIIPSPDGKQILISQWEGSRKKLLVADAEGNILRTIAEGTEVNGASWSPQQLMIAYQLKTVINGVESSGLYLYDVLTGKSMQIAVNIGNAKIRWSPSGEKIAVAELDESNYNSSIIYLKANTAETDENNSIDNDMDDSETKNIGYIAAINTEKKTLAIDRIELLFSSDEERIAELNLKSEDFIVGFYIYNENENLEWIEYKDNLSIELLDGTLLSEASMEKLEENLVRHKVLCNFTVKDNVLVKVSEQYTP
jgi:TolB protein